MLRALQAALGRFCLSTLTKPRDLSMTDFLSFLSKFLEWSPVEKNGETIMVFMKSEKEHVNHGSSHFGTRLKFLKSLPCMNACWWSMHVDFSTEGFASRTDWWICGQGWQVVNQVDAQTFVRVLRCHCPKRCSGQFRTHSLQGGVSARSELSTLPLVPHHTDTCRPLLKTLHFFASLRQRCTSVAGLRKNWKTRWPQNWVTPPPCDGNNGTA